MKIRTVPISYLRISVTDLCNFRCFYCRPPEGVGKIHHSEILRFEEIMLVVKAAVGLGIGSFRVTGGEPLVRRDVVHLLEEMGNTAGVKDLALTTNGFHLAGMAVALRRAGVGRINISLDSLHPATFARITRGGDLKPVLAGVEAALRAGFDEIKLNTVLMKDVNEDEIFDLIEFAGRRAVPIRFIEMMPMGAEGGGGRWFLALEEAKRRIEKRWRLELTDRHEGCGPAEYYRTEEGVTVGFIAPISACFCNSCNRLRLTAEGMVRPCLASDHEINIKGVIRSGGSIEEIAEVLKRAAAAKPPRHSFGRRRSPARKMVSIGG